jgi:hypothetical protein
MRKLLLTFGLCSVAAMASATAAAATPPERFQFSESGTEVLLQCDGVDIILDTTGTFTGTVFFDQSGEVVRFIRRGRITETLTNSVTGKTVVNRGVFQDFFSRIEGTDDFRHSVVGFDFQGKVAGRGPLVFWDVGRKVFDPETGEIVFHAGRTNLVEGPEVEAVFCTALT